MRYTISAGLRSGIIRRKDHAGDKSAGRIQQAHLSVILQLLLYPALYQRAFDFSPDSNRADAQYVRKPPG